MLKLAGFSFSATMEFAKAPLSYADQAALLIKRGLVVSDPNVLMLAMIRFGGHLPKGEYDVDHDGHAGQADAAELHG